MRASRVWLSLCVFLVPLLAVAQTIPISDLHQNDSQGNALMLGEIVTIQGVVTVPSGTFSSTYTDVYIQDSTGGVMLYSYEPIFEFALGDEVEVVGEVDQYHGMTEVITGIVTLVASGQPVPEPTVTTCYDVAHTFQTDGSEPNEGRLMRINNVTFDADSRALTDSTGTTIMYIDYDTGLSAPVGEFSVVGVIKQYTAGTSAPFTDGYEILPRFTTDYIYGTGPQFVDMPRQTDVAIGGATIEWTTDTACPTVLEIGTTPAFEMPPIDLGNSTTDHTVVLEGLDSATVYYCRAVAANDSGSTSSPAITIVAPAESSTGEIDVYFSRSVDTRYSTGVAAETADLSLRMIERIEAATQSIDFCFFSLTLDEVADALIAAHDRGVTVRVIHEYDNGDSAIQSLALAGIEVRNDGENESYMHNKFAVFDAGNDDETNDYVWTGSWNATLSGTTLNAENVVVVQDAALAAAYRLEFEEMWGGAFSGSKTNDTPHMFLVSGVRMEQYFSPTDDADVALEQAITAADQDILFEIYGFTLNSTSDAMKARFDAGVPVRGVLDEEQSTSEGAEWEWMSTWADVVLDNVEQGGAEDQILHNKILIADFQTPDSNPTVLTGSMNWTFSGAEDNDENTLVIHHATTANVFLQEWMARYHEAGGTWDIEVPNPLVPEFTWSPASPQAGQAVAFTDASTGDITGWSWSFGDGVGTSTEQNPTYTYAAEGTYTVTLEITDGTETASVSHAITVTGEPQPYPYTFFLPAAISAPGIGATYWTTDLDINNAGTETMSYVFLWLPRGEDNADPLTSAVYTLGPGVSVRHLDVLSSVFELEDAAGALAIATDKDTALLMSRTFTPGTAGTYGQAIRGYRAADLIPASTRVRVLFMTEDDGTRSNLGMLNGTDQPIVVNYELFGADGVMVSDGTATLPAYGNDQMNQVFADFAPIEAGYVDLWTATEGGRFACYGSVVDNTSGDPTTVPAQ